MNITDSDIKEAQRNTELKKSILAECYAFHGTFNRVMFPERFHLPYTRQHLQVLEVLDDESVKKAVFTAWRGGGKSSLMLGKCARDIVFRERRFILWGSKSATHSELWTENMKMELATSKRIKAFDFGSIKTKKLTDFEQGFSKKSWVASYPGQDDFQTLVLPRGANQQFRGLSFGPHRVGLLILDDFEDDEEVENEELRKKLKSKFIGSISETLPQHKVPGEAPPRIVYIDTIKHEDALICHLLESKDWVHVKLSLCTPKYISLAPDFISTEDVKKKAAYYREQGQLDVFAREFMCEPISREDSVFQQSMFKIYNETDEWFVQQRQQLRNVVIVDPAKTAKSTSAETGIVCWGVNAETNAMFLRYAWGERIHPDQIYQRAFEVADRFNALIIGVESSGLGEFVMHPFRNEAIRRGKHYEIMELKAKRGRGEFSGEGGGKKGRVASLIPFYRQGLIYHNSGTEDYELQLLGYPRSKRWDLMDAAAYITDIMDEMTLYFMSTDEKVNPYELTDEYQDLTIDDYKDFDEHREFMVI